MTGAATNTVGTGVAKLATGAGAMNSSTKADAAHIVGSGEMGWRKVLTTGAATIAVGTGVAWLATGAEAMNSTTGAICGKHCRRWRGIDSTHRWFW